MGSALTREQKRARIQLLRKVIAVLFALCVLLFFADIICGIVLIVKNSKSKSKSSKASISSLTSVTDVSDPSEMTTEPETTPVTVTMNEDLPVNDLAEAYWGPLPEVAEVKQAPHKEVHGLYIGAAAKMDANIAIAKNSEVNAFVIDLMEHDGVYFNSSNQFALDMGEVNGYYTLQNVVQKCHDNGIYVIGRIVCFNDPHMASKHPEMSIKDASGNSMKFSLEHNTAFVNP